jgi:hypothetical protein
MDEENGKGNNRYGLRNCERMIMRLKRKKTRKKEYQKGRKWQGRGR